MTLLFARCLCIPGLLVNMAFSDDKNPGKREVAVDIYVLLKFVLAICIISWLVPFEKENILFEISYWWVLFSIFETLISIATPIFCSPVFRNVSSYKRTVLLVLINYFEILIGFAFIYAQAGGLRFSDPGITGYTFHGVDYIYFSFLAGFTMSSGDIIPVSNFGRGVLTGQAVVFFFFATVFITYNFGKLSRS